jgi:hypothetical protein
MGIEPSGRLEPLPLGFETVGRGLGSQAGAFLQIFPFGRKTGAGCAGTGGVGSETEGLGAGGGATRGGAREEGREGVGAGEGEVTAGDVGSAARALASGTSDVLANRRGGEVSRDGEGWMIGGGGPNGPQPSTR